ncbi:MAG: amidohydrolase family protein [Deltaproteobacteria bacterium]|nr:amidohydrolase family protein [Deltaproteobacteria bacterium]
MAERIDMHVHVYEDEVARRAIANIRAFRVRAGILGVEIAEDGSPAYLQDEMARLGIGRSVIQAVVPRPEIMEKINAWTSEQVESSGGRLMAFGGLHPMAPAEALAAEIKRFMSEYGFRGVKLHPTLQGYDPVSTEAMRLYERIAAAGLPLLIHPDRRVHLDATPEAAEQDLDDHFLLADAGHVLTNERLCHIIESFPELTIVASHLGGSHSERLEALVKGSPKVWLDFAIVRVFFPEGPSHVAELVRRYGAENVLFGSDFPFWPQEAALTYLDQTGLTAGERRLMEIENPRRLLGL